MPDVDDSDKDLERHRVVFIEAAAIALWVAQDPLNVKKDLDERAKQCWLQAGRLWQQRTGV